MNEDHAFLDNLWAEYYASEKSQAASGDLLERFYQKLQRHIRLENLFLFPRFNQYLGFGDNDGPIPILIRDHRNILRLLARLEKVLNEGNYHDAHLISANFQKLMIKHRQRENEMGYPVYDSFIDLGEWKSYLEN